MTHNSNKRALDFNTNSGKTNSESLPALTGCFGLNMGGRKLLTYTRQKVIQQTMGGMTKGMGYLCDTFTPRIPQIVIKPQRKYVFHFPLVTILFFFLQVSFFSLLKKIFQQWKRTLFFSLISYNFLSSATASNSNVLLPPSQPFTMPCYNSSTIHRSPPLFPPPSPPPPSQP